MDFAKEEEVPVTGHTVSDHGVVDSTHDHNEVVTETASEVDDLDDLLSDADSSVYNPEEFSRSNPPFSPTREKYNGLNLGRIVLMEVTKVLSPSKLDDGNINTYEYAGLEVAKLHIQIDSADGILPLRSYHHNITIPVKATKKGGVVTPKFYNDKVSENYNMIQELFGAFNTVSCKALNPGEISPIPVDAFKLFPAYDNAKERRVLKWNKSMQLIADAFNFNRSIDGVKSAVFAKAGVGIPIWFSLVPSYASQYSQFALPERVGSGVIEAVSFDKNMVAQPPLISIAVTTSLALIPRPAKKGKGDSTQGELQDLANDAALGAGVPAASDFKF